MKKLILGLIILFGIYSCDLKTTTKSDSMKLDSVNLIKESDEGWKLEGMVRNNNDEKVKGFVKIFFLNISGDVINTAKTRVNEGSYINPGQSAVFDYYTAPKEFDGVVDFNVEFVEQ